ncbi:MAG: UvrD-helicase domain-containing protein, partial [Bacteroidales bacterium]|nr:UvrD-helicase domain-containing protein [Bacteroidales bacterium]
MSFTVYKSSAGSGKTFTLVKEYLKIVLKNPSSFRNILAITFTNKAANEMKERILEYLKELSVVNKKENSKAIEALMPE